MTEISGEPPAKYFKAARERNFLQDLSSSSSPEKLIVSNLQKVRLVRDTNHFNAEEMKRKLNVDVFQVEEISYETITERIQNELRTSIEREKRLKNALEDWKKVSVENAQLAQKNAEQAQKYAELAQKNAELAQKNAELAGSWEKMAVECDAAHKRALSLIRDIQRQSEDFVVDELASSILNP